MKKREQRLNDFITILNKRKFLTISEMAELLNVSDMTVRRDYALLCEKYPISMVNGIFMSNLANGLQPIQKTYDLDAELLVENDLKNELGRFAATLIQPNDCVIFDTGSTTGTIIPNIPQDMELRILCFNLNILLQAQKNPNIRISFAGGYYHPNAQMFESVQGIEFIHTVRANKVFVSAAGIHEKLGFTCINTYEVPTKQAILKSAEEKILIADSTKFGKLHAAYFCDFSDINAIITNKDLSQEWISLIESKGIKLYLV